MKIALEELSCILRLALPSYMYLDGEMELIIDNSEKPQNIEQQPKTFSFCVKMRLSYSELKISKKLVRKHLS